MNSIYYQNSFHSLKLITVSDDTLLLRFQRSIIIACRCSPTNQDSRTCDKCTCRTHQQFCHIGNLIRSSGTASRALCEHIVVKVTTRTIKFVNGQRGDNNPRRNIIQPCAALPPFRTARSTGTSRRNGTRPLP